jgi:hypothetical protein
MTRHEIPTGLLASAVLAFSPCPVQAEVRCGIDHAVVDGTRIAYAVPIEVVGRCVKTERFDLSHGVATLKVSRINGRANQDAILFHLHVAPGIPKGPLLQSAIAALESMKPEAWYKLRGYLADGEALAVGPAFSFVVERHEAISPAPLGFADFVDREARFEGRAASGGLLDTGGIKVKVDAVAEWPQQVIGKSIGVRGVVRHGAAGLHIERAEWSLLDLSDQVGQNVSLEGRLWSLNGRWWFEYRGEKLYVTDAKDHLLGSRLAIPTAPGGNVLIEFSSSGEIHAGGNRTPGPDYSYHGRRVRVSGRLERQQRPALDQISLKTDRDLILCYVVRRAAIQPLGPPPSFRTLYSTPYRVTDGVPELRRAAIKPLGPPPSFRTLYSTPYRVTDGVPELLPQHSIRRNIMGNETTTMFYYERNAVAIEEILRNVTLQTLDVLARRMGDDQLTRPLRLLYAAMLAAANDPRGRAFLLGAVRTEDEQPLGDALFCLGAVGWLMPQGSQIKTELAWAEPTLVSLMSRRDSQGDFKAGHIAAVSTSIPAILLSLNTAASRKALIEFALSTDAAASDVLHEICDSRTLLSTDELSRLETAAKDLRERRAVLGQLLRHKHPAAVARFAKDLDDSFVYMTVRDRLSPPIVEALKSQIGALTGKQRTHAQMLIILGEKDPVPSVIGLLDDPQWQDKNLALFELARLRDRRCVAPVARILREAAKDYFRDTEGLLPAIGIEHGLEVIAGAGSKEAVSELIGLLSVDLGRFGGYIDREGYRRIIAAHLIELTGESFGLDADAWRRWWNQQTNDGAPRASQDAVVD